MLCAVFIFSCPVQIIHANDNTFLSFQKALYHKEKALEIIRNQDKDGIEQAKKDLYIARDILLKILEKNPDKEIYYTLAEIYEADNDFYETIKVYESIVDKYGYDKISLFELGKRYWFLANSYQGKNEAYFNEYINKAIISFKKILDYNTNDVDAKFYLGYMSFVLNDFLSSTEYLTEILHTNMDPSYSFYTKYYIGMSEFFLCRFVRSVKNLGAINPANLSLEEALFYYAALSKSKQALEDYSAAYDVAKDGFTRFKRYDIDGSMLASVVFLSYMSGRLDKTLYDEALSSEKSVPFVITVIQISLEEGKHKALEMIETAIEKNTADLDIMQMRYLLMKDPAVKSSKDEIFHARKQLLSFYETLGIYDAIAIHAKDVVMYDKKYNEIYLSLSGGFLKNGQKEESETALSEYLACEGYKSKESISAAIEIAGAIRSYELIIKLYAMLSEMEKNNSYYKYSLAFYYSLVDENKKSLDALSQAEEIFYLDENSSDENYKKNCLLIAGSTALFLKDKNLALKYFGNLLSVYPEDKEIINGLAWALIDMDIDILLGMEYAQKVVALDPENPYYMDTLGWAYFKKGDFGKARDLFLEAIEKSDSEYIKSVSYYHLADTYHAMSKNDEALRYYEKAYRFRDSVPEIDEKYIIEKINELKTENEGK